MGLQGTISPHIGNLSFLVKLRLSDNNFYGFIPHEIDRLHRLRILMLASNQLEGSIPPSIQNCQKLHEVSFYMNHLIGAIPSSFGNMSTLEVMDLKKNSLTGPLPLVIFNISSLNIFSISYNNILGALPNDLCTHCPNLRGLSFPGNKFGGQLHSQFNNCGNLSILSLSYNKFNGSISKALIDSLQNLEVLYLGGNSFTGALPQKVFNLSTLQHIAFEENSFSGYLPTPYMGQSCPNLEEIVLSSNQLSGQIPSYLSNCSKLITVDFAVNLFSGTIPKSLGNWKHLQRLFLNANQLTGGETRDQEPNFISTLSNCRFLTTLYLSDNPLDMTIPDSIQNFSTSFQIFRAQNSQIRGHIPIGMGFLKGLISLDLRGNYLTGNIPFTLGGLERLQRLYLHSNRIKGLIPEEICQLRNLGELYLSNNKITGAIPNCISNLSFLQKLYLSSNRLETSIPSNIWGLKNLLFLDLSSNSFSGHLSSNNTKLITLEYLDLSRNEIAGEIPSIIGAFESLSYLDFSNNSFQGGIPQSFVGIFYIRIFLHSRFFIAEFFYIADFFCKADFCLDLLDLSYNNLSGVIPKSLEALPYLKYLNLSFNKLVGEIPFGGNSALCGNPIFGVPPCPTIPTNQQSKIKDILIKCILPVIASIIIFVMLVYLPRRPRKSNIEIPTSLNALFALEHRMISYQELCQGTNNFCETNLLGVGGFGSVYKGILFDRTIVAVKVLKCKVFRTIRHRNLIKVITTCTNPQFRALVPEYMSKGNLEKWLYSHNYCLDLLQRINIMVDVASALDYLHHGQLESILHCDLKPTNILLDEDMVAHVGDFGIAKILVENKDITHTKTLGTIGYIAPEYGFEGKVSIKTDLVNASIPDRMMEVVDEGLLRIEDGRDTIALQSILSSIMDLGLRCSEELPDTRMDIKDVLVKLNKIKSTFF
ncbi:hypothetical protein I3760_01G037100 [Carya illinoinensis]|nr:hypothetical protein I3760_01G037100 [Carya illinoinensis]